MKKNNIFNHELNESIQANAAMNCLKNRNKPQQMNEGFWGGMNQDEIELIVKKMVSSKMISKNQADNAYMTIADMLKEMDYPSLNNERDIQKFIKQFGDDVVDFLNDYYPDDEYDDYAEEVPSTLQIKPQSTPQSKTQEVSKTFEDEFMYLADLYGFRNRDNRTIIAIVKKLLDKKIIPSVKQVMADGHFSDEFDYFNLVYESVADEIECNKLTVPKNDEKSVAKWVKLYGEEIAIAINEHLEDEW